MELSIVIVNYNVQYFLENCLNSVFKATQNIDCEVIVVDNNSVDGSQKMLRNKFPQVQLIANRDNVGFSKANNQAIRIAKGENILLLNPDTVVEENTFEVCLDFFKKHPDAGGLGVKMLDGKGRFLPESKRGLPTPSVAFYKIFGLAQLFPKSKRFGKYHLGHLSKEENHSIEILSGAFMMIRKKVLDEIGLLDESFFMYGEDIDLSYRILQASYKNYYLADTSIIHYKGESTKKSSINYVFVFYRAMAIFAKKHFSSTNAKTFSFLIHIAIYLRAAMAVLSRTAKRVILPFLDAAIIMTGAYGFMEYYEKTVINNSNYFTEAADLYGIPILVATFILFFFLNGAYRIPTKIKSIFNGAFSGAFAVLIIYSMLSEAHRFSRAIVLFSVLWTLILIPAYRALLHFLKVRPFQDSGKHHLAIVGKKDELIRINRLIKDTLMEPSTICYVNADNEEDGFDYHGKFYQLKDIIDIYGVNEIIFCSKNLSSSKIISQMAALKNPKLDFKIAPPESLYIIGSNSNQKSGEYYIMGTDVLLKPANQRNKRLLDFILSLFFLLFSPIFVWFSLNPSNFFSNLFNILIGKISFVGLAPLKENNDKNSNLKKGILTPLDAIDNMLINEAKKERLNFKYVKDYNVFKDVGLIFKKVSQLGRMI